MTEAYYAANGANPGWTVARTARLKFLAADGFSASEIATDLGGVSRNGVIGKLYRLSVPFQQRKKLSPEEKAARRRARRSKNGNQNIVRRVEALQQRQVPRSSAQRKQDQVDNHTIAHKRREQIAHMAANELTNLPPEDAAAAVRFEDLNGNNCRWPIGDPRSLETIRFCGKGIRKGSYCAHHDRAAHR